MCGKVYSGSGHDPGAHAQGGFEDKACGRQEAPRSKGMLDNNADLLQHRATNNNRHRHLEGFCGTMHSIYRSIWFTFFRLGLNAYHPPSIVFTKHG